MRRAQAQRRTAVSLAIVLSVAVLLASGWKYSSDRAAEAHPVEAPRSGTTVLRAGTVAAESASQGMRALNPQDDPTPYFASYNQLKLRLPVSVKSVTEVGFHQASYSYARHMKSLVPYGDAEKAKKDRTTHRDSDKQQTGEDAVLTGEVLKLWRNRPGKPDTAVDIGANAGSTVYSPVSGTVVKVKRFDLYGRYPDIEIHIQPEGHPALDVVMIHLDDAICEPGDRVVAGVTPLARIRDLDPRIGPQLKNYTRNGGNHTHLQVNDATHPSYKGLKGAIKVEDL
jgi:biotin carboxyl carrier protein